MSSEDVQPSDSRFDLASALSDQPPIFSPSNIWDRSTPLGAWDYLSREDQARRLEVSPSLGKPLTKMLPLRALFFTLILGGITVGWLS